MRAFSGLVTLLAVLNISWAAYIWSLCGAHTHTFTPLRPFADLCGRTRLTVSDRFFFGWGCGAAGAGVGVWVWGVLGGCVGVSCWLAVAAAGGPLLAGVEPGVLGDVGVAGLAALLALYIGVLCLYWPGRVAEAPGAADSSGWRAAWRGSRPEPPALAVAKEASTSHGYDLHVPT